MTIMLRPSGSVPLVDQSHDLRHGLQFDRGFHDGVETETIELMEVLLPHLQRIPGLVFLDLKSEKLVNRFQGLRVKRNYTNPRALLSLFELVLNIALQLLHHRHSGRCLVVN